MNRRSFLRSAAGLLVPLAPAIVRADSLMPLARVHDPVMPGEWLRLIDRCGADGRIQREVRDARGRTICDLSGLGMLPRTLLSPGRTFSAFVRPRPNWCEVDGFRIAIA
jgi:hypothetical protein